VERVTDQNILALIVQKDKEYSDIRIAASRRLVNYDPDEDLLMYIIHMLGGELKNSREKREKEEAAEVLLAWYRRYREGKQGKEIRMYEGVYRGGYSDYRDSPHMDGSCNDPCHSDFPHDDYHTDSRYTIRFNPEEA
jgi:hypothetical protein